MNVTRNTDFMDRRQIKTRKSVFRAFTELLDEKGYSATTIQDIIDRADIGRSTFYSHFETKEDLLKAMCEDIFNHAFSGQHKKEEHHDFSDRDSLEDELTHLLYHLNESRSAIRSILSSETGSVFMSYFKERLMEMFDKDKMVFPKDVPEDYVIDQYVSGFTETVRWWMDHDEYSPEQVMDFYWKMQKR